LILWGVQGIKTFKPIIKDLHRQQFYGMESSNSSPAKHSKDVKAYKKKVIKIIIATLVLSFISILAARDFVIDIAD